MPCARAPAKRAERLDDVSRCVIVSIHRNYVILGAEKKVPPVVNAARAGTSDIEDLTLAAESAELAASVFYRQGFHCGESVVKAVNDALGQPLAPEVSKLASGFCEGLGGSRCICGALAGGVMAIGLSSGRVSPQESWEPSYYATAELRRRWVEDQRAESCDEVVQRIGTMDMPERWEHCTALVGRTARWVVEISQMPAGGDQRR
jgi:C_GCAxxG_C_C family probable redox protein